MLEQLRQNWWVFAVRGVAAILFGIGAFAWPGLTLALLVTLFGAYALANGIFEIVTAVRNKRQTENWWALLLSGILGILIGLATWFMPALTALTLVYVFAGWAIATGLLGVISAIRLRREIRGEWLYVLAGIMSIGTGVVMAMMPGPAAVAIVWVLGAYAVAFGIVLLSLGLRLRREREPARRARFRPSVPSAA